MMDYYEAISYWNLYRGLKNSVKGVKWKDSVAGYYANAMKRTWELHRDLMNGSYRISKYSIFKIHEPKEREIIATRLRDRQFQNALVENILYPEFVKKFTETNCACIKGRGTDYAIKLLKKELIDYYWEHHSNKGWVYQFDIHHYFPETSIRVAQKVVEQFINEKEALARTCEVLESFSFSEILQKLIRYGIDRKKAENIAYRISSIRSRSVYLKYMGKQISEGQMMKRGKRYISDEKFLKELLFSEMRGIGLGSNISQLVMLAILDHLDHVLLNRYGKHVRYMDDFMILSDNRAEAEHARMIVEKELEMLGLRLNTKSALHRIQDGIHFLHWRFILTETGKMILKKEKKKLSQERRVLKKLKKRLDERTYSIEKIRQSFESWQAHMEKGNTYYQVQNMRELYQELFNAEAPHGNRKIS